MYSLGHIYVYIMAYIIVLNLVLTWIALYAR